MKKVILLWIGLSVATLQMVCVAQTTPTPPDSSIASSFDSLRQRTIDEKFNYYFQEAIRLKSTQQYAAAFELFNYCLSLDSTDATVLSELGLYYMGIRQEEKAFQYFLKAHQMDPDNEWMIYQLASFYLNRKDYEPAIELITQLVNQDPKNYEFHYHIADLYLNTHREEEAINELNKLESILGITKMLSEKKSAIYQQLKQPQKAIAEMERLYRSKPDDPSYINLYGQAYLQNDAPKKALKLYTQSLQKDPNNGETLLYLVDYYQKTDNKALETKYLQEIIDNPKVDTESKIKSLTYFIKSTPNDTLTIEKSFATVLEQSPDEYAFREMHLQWLLANGRENTARNELRNVLDMNPNQKDIWHQYLSLNLVDNHFDTIRSICREALTYFPEDPTFWYYIALTYSAQGNSDEAIQAYQKSLARASGSNKDFASRILGYLGDTYYNQGDTTQAYQCFEKALAESANNDLVLNNYAYFLSLEGKDLEKAEKMSRRSLDIEPNNSTYLDTYAWICFSMGKYSLAKIYIERALVNAEEDRAEITEHYGDILWFCDEKDAAQLQWINAINLYKNPSDTLKKKVQRGVYIK